MAVIDGRASILKLQLETGFHTNVEYRGKTVLMQAEIKGYEEIIKLLRDAEYVNPNFPLAAEDFGVGAMGLLLSGKRTDRHLKDLKGRKAWSWARNGRKIPPQYRKESDAIIEMLTDGDEDVVSEENEEQECARLGQNSAVDCESVAVITQTNRLLG